jgi:hypothetical protein
MRKILLIVCLLLTMSSLTLAQGVDLIPYAIALERIAEAERTEALSLDLSGLGLSEVPPEIGNLTNLQILYLYTNQLSSLPPEIGNLSNLQWLHLSNNQLNSLPPEIGNLSNLQGLYLSDTQLNSLPPEIGNLSNLKLLSVSSNQLSSLPPEIGNLSQLCRLDIRENRMRHLPTELAELHNLNLIDIDCTSPSGLYLEGNPLITPPEEVIAEGTAVILEYLRNPLWWYMQRYSLWITSAVGVIALFFLGIIWRMRRNQRKPKAKRGDIS